MQGREVTDTGAAAPPNGRAGNSTKATLKDRGSVYPLPWMYDRIVSTRLDFVWHAPHPPLATLPSEFVWIPEGSDFYGGFNDRHAVLSRQAAEIYMRRYDYIHDGCATCGPVVWGTRVWHVPWACVRAANALG